MKRGIAYLVGAGPGDLGLVTLRAREVIELADVIIYDYLCNPEMLGWARESAEILYAGKQGGEHSLPQEQINTWLIKYIRAGKTVVRLKGGDPFIFGRGGEEAQAIVAAGLPLEVVPGVTSAIAVPAYAGIPLTHRDFTSSVTFLTGHEDPEKETSALDWKQLAADPGTRVILMAIGRLRKITETLLRYGAPPETPCALIRWGTYPRQQVLEGALGTILELSEKNKFRPPAIFIIGEVVRLRQELNWYENRPLFGRRIVVTRTRSQASALTGKLRAWGADVLEIPTIRIEPRDWIEEYDLEHWEDNFDWLIFTSPNAVDLFFEGFFAVHGDLRKLGKVKIAAVGPSTAAKVRSFHLSIVRQPTKFTVEELAQSFEPEEITGLRFCLVRGNLADPTLPHYLRGLGGLIQEWIIYQTLPETKDTNGASARFLKEGADWIIFTSSSTVSHWHDLHPLSLSERTSTKYASMGPVTSRTMQTLGYPITCEAEESTLDGLVDAILQCEAKLATQK